MLEKKLMRKSNKLSGTSANYLPHEFKRDMCSQPCPTPPTCTQMKAVLCFFGCPSTIKWMERCTPLPDISFLATLFPMESSGINIKPVPLRKLPKRRWGRMRDGEHHVTLLALQGANGCTSLPAKSPTRWGPHGCQRWGFVGELFEPLSFWESPRESCQFSIQRRLITKRKRIGQCKSLGI